MAAMSRASTDLEKRSVTVDKTFAKTGLTVGQLAGTERKNPFGHQFYRSPKADTKYNISIGHPCNREKRKNFADLEAKVMDYVPGPKYLKQPEWKDNIKSRQGKFLCKPRKTFTEDIMDYEKKLPAPSKFDNKEKLKKLIKTPGNYLQ